MRIIPNWLISLSQPTYVSIVVPWSCLLTYSNVRYEVFCSHCYRRQSQLGGATQLKSCDACQLATFCSDCPQRHSLDECQKFCELAEDEKWMLEHSKRQTEANQPTVIMACTETPRNTYLPLSAAGSWYEYYTRISDKDLTGFRVTSDLRPGSNGPLDLSAVGFLRASTRSMSIPLTIIAALEKLFPDLSTRSSIKLHLIGANEWEIERLMVFEEILHLLPALKKLHLTLVGLEIPRESVSEDILLLDCCPSCSSRDRTRSVFPFRGSYHDFLGTKHYDRPDLAVAFHTGFSQAASEHWMPTICHLANAEHPTLFTTYNKEEMREETMILSHMKATFVQEGEINKWKSVCPLLEPMGSMENNVYYLNQYCYIIAPRNA